MEKSIAIVGPGRLGTSLARSLRLAGLAVTGPHGRGFTGDGSQVTILCVPDSAIAEAAGLVDQDTLVGHTSGASPLAEVGDRPAFGLHPLMTFPGGEVQLEGVWCAVSGSTPEALTLATDLAEAVGMKPFPLADDDRAAYHAAASIASNFLVTLEADAAKLARAAGVPEEALIPLVRATMENWASAGPERALTGPITRGDATTVERQRQAVIQYAPELTGLFDVMADRTRQLALRTDGVTA